MIDVIRSMCRVDLSCLDLTRYSPLPSIPLARLLLLQQVLPAAAQPPDGRIACCRCRLLSSPTSTHSRAIFATSKLVRGKSSGATSWRAHSNRRAQLKFRAVRESFSRYFDPLHWNLHSISVSLVSFNSAQAQALFAWRVATSHSTTAPANGNPIYGQYTNRMSSF